MSLLPRRSDRMNTPGGGVPVALNLAMDPLPGVGEERMTKAVRRWPRWSTPSTSRTTRRWITTAEGCPVSGQRSKPHGVCRPWKFWPYRKRIDSTTQTPPPMDAIQTVIPVDPYLHLSTRTSPRHHHHVRKRGFPIRSQRAMYRLCSLCPLPPVVGPRSIFSDELASARLTQPEDTLDHRVGFRAPP